MGARPGALPTAAGCCTIGARVVPQRHWSRHGSALATPRRPAKPASVRRKQSCLNVRPVARGRHSAERIGARTPSCAAQHARRGAQRTQLLTEAHTPCGRTSAAVAVRRRRMSERAPRPGLCRPRRERALAPAHLRRRQRKAAAAARCHHAHLPDTPLPGHKVSGKWWSCGGGLAGGQTPTSCSSGRTSMPAPRPHPVCPTASWA